MKVLVLNCGSSSIKYKLFEMTTKEVLAQGGIEKIGLPGSFLKLTLPSGEKKIIEKDVPEHTTGVQFIFDTLTNPEYGAVKDLHEIKAVGHRVLHGGTKFSGSVLIEKVSMPFRNYCQKYRKSLYLTLHSTKQCPTMPICTLFHTAILKNTASAGMASMELLTVMYLSVFVISWAFHKKVHESLLATLETEALSQL